MADLAALKALRDRVRKATGPDRELDDAIWCALCWESHWRKISRDSKQSRFTSSIDAALALVEIMLPGWSWGFFNHFRKDDQFTAMLCNEPSINLITAFDGDGVTVPLALLAALLSVLIAQQEGG